MANPIAEAQAQRAELVELMLTALERHDAAEARRLRVRITETDAELAALIQERDRFKARVKANPGRPLTGLP